MAIFDQVKAQVSAWTSSLDVADHMMLLALGLALILFSVFALILQGVLAKRSDQTIVREPMKSNKTRILGERHMANKSAKKEDPFLRRLEHLA